VINSLDRFLGPVASWLPILIFFPIATASIGKLSGGSLLARASAGILYSANPFVFDRIYAGQIPLLIAYALLPLAVRSLIRTAEGATFWPSALWMGVLIALSIQLAWILGLIGLAVGCVYGRQRLRGLGRILAAGAIGAGMSAYAISGLIVAGGTTKAPLSELLTYSTSSDPRFGLFVNVAGLYGFWRPGPVEPKNLIAGWPILLIGILVVVAIGMITALRSHPYRRTARCLLAVGIAGYFLALGSQGPTGFIYRFAFEHVPGFAVLREPEKFSMLIALCYACGFAWGVDRLARAEKMRWRRATIGVLVLALPCAYTSNLVGGLGGQLQASRVPSSWEQAAQIVRGHSLVLFLPWHEYQAFPFTGGRVVATPAASNFPAPVLVSSESGPGYQPGPSNGEDSFVSTLIAHGADTDAGAALSTIGVGWIIVAKVNDWRSYSWLGHQPGLRRVLDTRDIEVFRNLVRSKAPAHLSGLHEVTSLPQALTAGSQNLAGAVLSATAVQAGLKLRAGSSAISVASDRELSPTSYAVTTRRAGWLALPIPYQSGWTLDGKPAVALATGNLAVHAQRSGDLSFDGSSAALWGDTCSAVIAVVAVCGVFLADLRRRRNRQEVVVRARYERMEGP
jgi:hypothetical protein